MASKNSSTPTKRSYDVHEIQTDDNATVHGCVVDLSPVKTSQRRENCRYFSGKLSDGIGHARFISFNPDLRSSFEKFKKDNVPVALTGCIIQPSSYDSSLEIKTSKSTFLQQSPKKFKFDTNEEKSNATITIDALSTIAVNQKVTVSGKIIKNYASTDVTSKFGKTLTKQDCLIRDCNGTCRVVLWQQDIGKLNKGQSYQLQEVVVRQFDNVKYLSVSDCSIIEPIADIQEVSDDDEFELQAEITPMVAKGEISAVMQISDYITCVNCNGNVLTTNTLIGKCSKCKPTVKLNRCHTTQSAKFIISSEGNTNWHLIAYNDELMAIIKDVDGASIENKLFNSGELKLFYDKQNVVKQVVKV